MDSAATRAHTGELTGAGRVRTTVTGSTSKGAILLNPTAPINWVLHLFSTGFFQNSTKLAAETTASSFSSFIP